MSNKQPRQPNPYESPLEQRVEGPSVRSNSLFTISAPYLAMNVVSVLLFLALMPALPQREHSTGFGQMVVDGYFNLAHSKNLHVPFAVMPLAIGYVSILGFACRWIVVVQHPSSTPRILGFVRLVARVSMVLSLIIILLGISVCVAIMSGLAMPNAG